jgi:hypothetical protein
MLEDLLAQRGPLDPLLLAAPLRAPERTGDARTMIVIAHGK